MDQGERQVRDMAVVPTTHESSSSNESLIGDEFLDHGFFGHAMR